MFFETIAGPYDADHCGVMQQPFEQCRCDYRVAEHLAPFGEGSVGSEDFGNFLISDTGQLEEQSGSFFGQMQEADLIDDEQRVARELADFCSQRT